MPGLLLMIIGISIFSLTLRFEDGNGVVRTGLQGLSVYVLRILTALHGSAFWKFFWMP